MKAPNLRNATTVKIDKKTRNQTRGVNILIKVVILESSAGYAVNMYHGMWCLRVAMMPKNQSHLKKDLPENYK